MKKLGRDFLSFCSESSSIFLNCFIDVEVNGVWLDNLFKDVSLTFTHAMQFQNKCLFFLSYYD